MSTTITFTHATDECYNTMFEGSVVATLTASLELAVEAVEEGDSGEEEGEERSEGDGEEELEEALLWGADGRTTTSSSSGTLLLHSSSCWDSNSVTSFPTDTKRDKHKSQLSPKLSSQKLDTVVTTRSDSSEQHLRIFNPPL